MIRNGLVVCFVVACALASAPSARAGDPPPAAKPLEWKEAAQKAGLDPALIERLERDRMAIAGPSYLQVFTPYISPWPEPTVPVFVTSDSVFAGYDALLEESILRVERARAARLPGALRFLWDGLVDVTAEGRADGVRTPANRERLVLGVALRLLGSETPGVDAEARRLIAEEAALVESATGTGKPAWLGPPDPGFLTLDHARFRPRGFYDRSDALRRYFRAVAWLHEIPFRIERDEELRSFLSIADALDRLGVDGDERARVQRTLAEFESLLGPGDDLPLVRGESLFGRWKSDPRDPEVGRREALRVWKERGGARIQGSAAEPGTRPEPSFRILAAARTGDAVLFQRVLDAQETPSGLVLGAAMGSRWAREALTKAHPALGPIADRARDLAADPGLYAEAIRCLSSLLDPVEAAAPDYMQGELWARKSLQSALSGWAQLRHAWALQAKENFEYRCGIDPPVGFVEASPEFFARLGRLAKRSRDLFSEVGAFEPGLGRAVLADEIAEYVAMLRRGGASDSDRWLEYRIHSLCEFVAWSPSADRDAQGAKRSCLDAWEGLIADLRDPERRLSKGASAFLAKAGTEVESRWKDLEIVCLRLEVLAHKQLRGVEFTDPDRQFLREYGTTLARLMFYDGNAFLTPRDDAPRIVDVVSILDRTASYLEVGTARPRAIYVLHPTATGPVLCRGAVVPYYEFRSPTLLTDDEWRARLDGDAPRPPEYLRPILHSEDTRLPPPKDK